MPFNGNRNWLDCYYLIDKIGPNKVNNHQTDVSLLTSICFFIVKVIFHIFINIIKVCPSKNLYSFCSIIIYWDEVKIIDIKINIKFFELLPLRHQVFFPHFEKLTTEMEHEDKHFLANRWFVKRKINSHFATTNIAIFLQIFLKNFK